MKWTAEADLVVGLAVGSGKRKLGVGLGIGRRKIIKNSGIDLGEHHLKRCGVFFLKNSSVLSLNWSLDTRNSILLDRDKAMKRSNVFNLLLQMMPASHHPVAPSSPDHWSFLDEVDAPRWADLVKEAALMGTIGDDAWFHRSHLHHETPLERAENLVTVSDSKGSSIEIPSVREPQPTKRRKAEKEGGKGTVSKLIKPALKATVVKACLGGGLQRISSAGSNSRGRLSSRSRLSTSLSKKVNIIHRSGGLLLQQQKKVGFDTRAAQSEPSSTVGTPKKPSEAKASGNNNLLRSEPPLKHVREAAAQKVVGPLGEATDRGDASDASRSVSGESDDTSLKRFESPASISLYPVSGPLGKGVDNFSQTDSVAGKSSPSDMYLSSDASPRHSISSQESLIRALSAAATESARRKILALGRRSVKGRSNESFETPSDLSHSAEITPVDEPHLEISSFNADEIVTDDTSTTTSGLGWNTQQEPTSVVKKRRSLGPPLRLKMTEKVGSSSVKKKSSSRNTNNNNLVGGAAARAPAEKSSGVPATHPILEKLRRSWGSALRVKQRNDAEAALTDTRSDTSPENSAEFKAGSKITTRKKWDESPVHSEVMKRTLQAGSATANQPHSDTETMIRNIVTRERRAAITLRQQHLQAPQLQLVTDAGVLVSPTKFSSNDSENRKGEKTYDSTYTKSKPKSAAPNVAKVDLAKSQANLQRSKSDLPSKFKKQYVHADTGLSKSLSMQRGNKENVQLELKSPSPPSGLGIKRKPAVPMRKQLCPRHLGTAVNTARSVPPQAPARTSGTAHANARPNPPSTTQTNPAARNLFTSRSGLLWAPTTKTLSLDAADASTFYKTEVQDRKAHNLAVLRGNRTSSVPKLTKQKSEKIHSTTVNEAFTQASGTKACKNDVKVADEFVVAAEDRKPKAALKYEPRIHTVKAIREWESKSGKRYYDLSPPERQKVNQNISAAAAAAAAAALKTGERKKS